jgi:hypothetical protein
MAKGESSNVNGTNDGTREPVEAVDTSDNGAEDKAEDNDDEEVIERFPPDQEAVRSQCSYLILMRSTCVVL